MRGRRPLPRGVPPRVFHRPPVFRGWAEDELEKLTGGAEGWIVEILDYKARGLWECKVVSPSGGVMLRDMEKDSSEAEIRYAVRSLHEELKCD